VRQPDEREREREREMLRGSEIVASVISRNEYRNRARHIARCVIAIMSSLCGIEYNSSSNRHMLQIFTPYN